MEAVTIGKWIRRNGCLLWLLIFSEIGKNQYICRHTNSTKVCIGLECSGGVFVLLCFFFFGFVIKFESSHCGPKVR